MSTRLSFVCLFLAGLAAALPAAPQDEGPQSRPEFPGRFGRGGQDGPPMGMGPGGGPGGMGKVREVVKDFDKNGDHRLDREERQAAREALKSRGGQGGRGGMRGGLPGGGPGGGGRRGGMGGPGGMGSSEPGRPGPKVTKDEVKPLPDHKLYDQSVIRTLFLDFDDQDWEAEMGDFYHTDVDVPATLTVDGKPYPNVGARFRGASSYFTVPAGSKRSLNLSLDHVDKKQRLLGYKTLNLLNMHEDPSFLHTVLYFHIANALTPAPKANLVRLVINGESWGVYTSAQQFDKVFLDESYKSSKGTRWKVQGSPGGQGGLEYVGDALEPYKQRYQIKSADDEKDWRALITLCKTLCTTDSEGLVKALEPMLDIDSVLWFLAIENVLVNNDGYWIRASDYGIFLDAKGKFHIVPHDANETFAMRAGGPGGMGRGGPGRQGGPGGPPAGPEGSGGAAPRIPGGVPGSMPGGMSRQSGIELDPLVGLDDARKPLRSKLLKVPELRARYLSFVKRIADEWLDWNKLGPVVASYRALLEPEVKADTRKLSSYEAFKAATADVVLVPDGEPRRGPQETLREFADKRRAWLLAHPALK